MTRWAFIPMAAFLFTLLQPMEGYGQFMDLRLSVDPQITASVERPLDFGIVFANSGRQVVRLGDQRMGIFSIQAMRNRLVLIELNAPESLQHTDPEISAHIPLQLQFRYGYSIDAFLRSTPLSGNRAEQLTIDGEELGNMAKIYLFVYGNIEVGAVPEGRYGSDLVLYVEYL